MSTRLGPEPRVNAKRLAEHRGQTVRLTAKVVKIDGDSAVVQASDGGEVPIQLSRDMHISDPYVEIIGSVRDDLSVRALASLNIGSTIDMKAVDAIVEFAHSSKGEGVLA